MNNLELIKQLLKRLKKFSWVIAIIAIGFGGFFYYIARQSILTYTSFATVFPLNSSGTGAAPSSITSLLGMTDASSSFTGDASINIVELASSRRTREAVAMARIPKMGNKTVAQLLIEENNKYLGFKQNEKIPTDQDSLGLVNVGSSLLNGGFNAKIGKTGILELRYTNSNPQLVREISYIYIDKLSDFYIELKKKKAQIDYEFAVKKADSLAIVADAMDKQTIYLDEHTFFTNQDLKRFSIPKTNLEQDKGTVRSQYYFAISNRESAAYRLQKETPIIEPLDKPEPPYVTTQTSKVMYAIIGILLGTFIGLVLVSWKVISNFIGAELNKAIEKATKGKEEALVAQTEPIK